ncbi:DUF1134 domain-containing protein [Altererythrobacter sp. MF3-039]|uniref:DUF1134 domain-containing protein n=1 Tax=Altererythrobacter sp. MF3-039 TaxID=3252901 RepID=UPI00390CD153
MSIRRIRIFAAGLVATLAMLANPAIAQVETIDPNNAIDADLVQTQEQQIATAAPAAPSPQVQPQADATAVDAEIAPSWSDPVPEEAAAEDPGTYGEDDLIGAAEGVFGKGSEGLAKMIESLLKDQGRPNGYIVGREAGGAFIAGVRYGSGTLYHKIEGQMPVYWTGPSIGFDAGANAGNTFVLVYNLYDTEEMFERYPSGEGQAYLIGGLHASYLRKGDIVLIPIRMGAGLRLGVNAGYMKFSKKQRWLPF